MPKIRRILCPIDFSEFSATAYRYALSIAQHYEANLFVQHVVEVYRLPSAGFVANARQYEEFCERLVKNAGEKLKEFVRDHAENDVQPERIVEHGIAPDSIL